MRSCPGANQPWDNCPAGSLTFILSASKVTILKRFKRASLRPSPLPPCQHLLTASSRKGSEFEQSGNRAKGQRASCLLCRPGPEKIGTEISGNLHECLTRPCILRGEAVAACVLERLFWGVCLVYSLGGQTVSLSGAKSRLVCCPVKTMLPPGAKVT